MKYARWLNPIMWFWALFHVAAILPGWLRCDACEFTPRGEVMPFENLCEYHQARFRAAFGDRVDEWWWA